MSRYGREVRIEHDCGPLEARRDLREQLKPLASQLGFQGSRAYFICPGPRNGTDCGRRITKLHLSQRYFLCRHCNQLAYKSQFEQPLHRALSLDLGGQTKRGSALVSVPGLPSRFPISPGGCGHALTASYSMKYYRPRYWPTKPRRIGSNGFRRSSRTPLNEV